MKLIKFTFLFTLLEICKVNGQPTDLKEYGLKGAVKSITTYDFKNIMYLDGNWIPIDFNDFINVSYMHFNKEGNIDTSRSSYRTIDSVESVTTVYQFENNRKTGAKYYDNQNINTQNITIIWLNAFTYKAVTKDLKGNTVYESTSWLDKNYRDSCGEYKSIESGKLVLYEKYCDVFDENMYLKGADFTDALNNKGYYILYKQLEFDRYKNIKSSILINTTDGSIKKLTVRTVEYY